jgi:hypothetical protein
MFGYRVYSYRSGTLIGAHPLICTTYASATSRISYSNFWATALRIRFSGIRKQTSRGLWQSHYFNHRVEHFVLLDILL